MMQFINLWECLYGLTPSTTSVLPLSSTLIQQPSSCSLGITPVKIMSAKNEWPPILTTAQEEQLLALASDYSLSHGLIYRPALLPKAALSTTTAIHAPYSLFPSPFPRNLFEQALTLQPAYNALYAHVTVDNDFLDDVVGGAVAKVDEFQGKLYELWKQVEQEGVKQPLHLGLFRSDYLLHCPPSKTGDKEMSPTIKQVEFNTISSSFGALSSAVGDMHHFLQAAGAYPDTPELSSPGAMPSNGALVGLTAGLAAAHNAYNSPGAKILMVIQDNERNAFDQRPLEWELISKHGIGLLRIPLSELHAYISLDSQSSSLLVTHPSSYSRKPTEISVVYYRAGYAPSDYSTPREWATRLLIERSLAIKCPTIALQLAGAKKVQQVLSEPKRLERFLGVGSTGSSLDPLPVSVLTKEHSELLQASFTDLYPLDNSELGQKALKLAYEEPNRFVLKPQREGGGNNVYRQDIPPFLDDLKAKDVSKREGEPLAREGYILMDLILPPQGAQNIMVRAGDEKGTKAEVVSELGIYGITLFKRGLKEDGRPGRGAEILVNETVGYLLRTKGKDSDEGGVAVGFSVIDSILLT